MGDASARWHDCSICLQEVDPGASPELGCLTPCGHVFHLEWCVEGVAGGARTRRDDQTWDSLQRWRSVVKTPSVPCPVCRNVGAVVQLFLGNSAKAAVSSATAAADSAAGSTGNAVIDRLNNLQTRLDQTDKVNMELSKELERRNREISEHRKVMHRQLRQLRETQEQIKQVRLLQHRGVSMSD